MLRPQRERHHALHLRPEAAAESALLARDRAPRHRRQDHVGAGRALERPLVRLAPARPRDRGAVRIAGFRGSQQMRRSPTDVRAWPGVAQAPEAIHSSRSAELCGSQPSMNTPLIRRLISMARQDRVDGLKPPAMSSDATASRSHSVRSSSRGHHRVEPFRGARGDAQLGTGRRATAPTASGGPTATGRSWSRSSVGRLQRSALNGANVSW